MHITGSHHTHAIHARGHGYTHHNLFKKTIALHSFKTITKGQEPSQQIDRVVRHLSHFWLPVKKKLSQRVYKLSVGGLGFLEPYIPGVDFGTRVLEQGVYGPFGFEYSCQVFQSCHSLLQQLNESKFMEH